LVAAAALLVLVLYPLITILIQSVVPGLFTAPARLNFSLAPFSRAFGNHEVYAAMFNTLWLGIAVAVIGALTGAVLAVLLVRTSLPGKALFDGLVWVTLFTPSYLVALAWELLFSRGGFIDTTIVPLPDGVVTTIFSPVGLTILLVLRLFPFSFLAVRAALGGLGSEYEEAGRMVGAGTLRCWLRINGPLLAPALFAGGLIIFAEAISDYGTAATIAQQAGFNLVTYELYAAINNEPVDFAMSAALSLVLVAAIAAAFLVQARLLRARSYQVITGRTRQARPALLGRWRWPLTAALGVFFFAVERTRMPGRSVLRLLTLVTLAIPGVVLAAGYIFAWNQPWMNNLPGGTPYGTIGLLLAAYIAGALPFSARLASGSLAQVGDHLLEAARLTGANSGRVFTRIVLPLVAGALLSTWMLVFTGTIFELPASELLQPPG
jgi:ABC-type Fe3+ transport system permease subunit